MTQDLNERIELRTERLLLRPFDLRDVDDVLAYASEPEFGWYLSLPQPYTRDHAAKFVAQQILDDWSTSPTFAMVFEGHVVGGIGLRVGGRTWRGRAWLRPGKAALGQGSYARSSAGGDRLGLRAIRRAQGRCTCGPGQPAVVARDGEAGHDPRGLLARATKRSETSTWTTWTTASCATSGSGPGSLLADGLLHDAEGVLAEDLADVGVGVLSLDQLLGDEGDAGAVVHAGGQAAAVEV